MGSLFEWLLRLGASGLLIFLAVQIWRAAQRAFTLRPHNPRADPVEAFQQPRSPSETRRQGGTVPTCRRLRPLFAFVVFVQSFVLLALVESVWTSRAAFLPEFAVLMDGGLLATSWLVWLPVRHGRHPLVRRLRWLAGLVAAMLFVLAVKADCFADYYCGDDLTRPQMCYSTPHDHAIGVAIGVLFIGTHVCVAAMRPRRG